MFAKVLRTLAGQERKAAPTSTTGRRGPACTRCKGSLPVGARRCSRCGTRVPTAETAETTLTAPPRPIRPIEAAILRGALAGGRAGSPSVFVTPSQGAVVGEIKVGGERIFGDEAVRAVATLVADGNLAPYEDGFALTAVGRLRAQRVSA